MDDSIFLSIKSLLGSDADYEVFDQDILIFINGVFATLTQLGIGPASGFKVTGPEEKWSDFLSERDDLGSVKTYVYMKVKLVFDPPTSSSVISAYQEACREFEWRLNVAVEPVEA